MARPKNVGKLATKVYITAFNKVLSMKYFPDGVSIIAFIQMHLPYVDRKSIEIETNHDGTIHVSEACLHSYYVMHQALAPES